MLMLIAAELQIRQNKYIFNQSNIYNNVYKRQVPCCAKKNLPWNKSYSSQKSFKSQFPYSKFWEGKNFLSEIGLKKAKKSFIFPTQVKL